MADAETQDVRPNGHAVLVPVSVHDVVRFQEGLETGEPEHEDKPVFLLGHWTGPLQTKWVALLTRRGLRFVSDDELYEELLDGIDLADVSEEERMASRALVESYRATVKELAEQRKAKVPIDEDAAIPRATARAMQRLRDAIGLIHPPYALLQSMRIEHGLACLEEAGKLMLRGWERVGIDYEKRQGHVTQACWARLPRETQQAIGRFALDLLRPTEAQAKN